MVLRLDIHSLGIHDLHSFYGGWGRLDGTATKTLISQGGFASAVTPIDVHREIFTSARLMHWCNVLDLKLQWGGGKQSAHSREEL